MAPVATEFEKIIHTARERKKNEALADKIFSTNRREPKTAPRGSLASRVGVKKPQQASPAQRQRASIPAGDVNGEWIHDLHNAHDDSPRGRSLRSRITQPGAAHAHANGNGNGNGNATATAHNVAQRSNRKRAAQLSAALDRMDTDATAEPRRQPGAGASAAKLKPAAGGISIRGIAGPFAVLAQNFAPGTTAADIESAMTPVGGEMISCSIIKTQPMMLVEMVFSSREGGERADGRVIQVFAKPGGYQPDHSARNGAHAHANTRSQIVDGRNGFSEDLMAVDNTASSSAGVDRLFYIDKAGPANKRGRGFQRGQGGR
ncbi:putative RNA-binding protein [Escovopsis weberi]|uniref:Putative RNA-binding protein n=1 Tax=Escovopsis weberi TaxID=150374 RepID=A0A0M8N145_ESCWE|nr:putative RNA-binding protein [Escovopsis weberi]